MIKEDYASHATCTFSNLSPIATFYQKYAKRILAIFWKSGIKAEDAEDLLLEVFIAAVENPGLLTLQEYEQIAWLQRVAHNKLIDHYRRQSYRQTTDLEACASTLFDRDELA